MESTEWNVCNGGDIYAISMNKIWAFCSFVVAVFVQNKHKMMEGNCAAQVLYIQYIINMTQHSETAKYFHETQ